jgi:predicted transcriptional regulator
MLLARSQSRRLIMATHLIGTQPGTTIRLGATPLFAVERELVVARMKPAAILVTASPETRCRVARALARKHGVHHLPVLRAGRLVGVLCVCDLDPAPADAPVERWMSTELLVLDARATLGDAAAAMKTFKVGCLPVVADGALVGLVTVGDLSRIGVPDELLGVVRCASCGSDHCVRTSPRAPGVGLCLACMRRAKEALALLELGEAE